jgi:hypothetical protein
MKCKYLDFDINYEKLNNFLLNILSKLEVLCPKCNQKSSYKDLDKHFNFYWTKTYFKCLGYGCGFFGLKDEIDDHVKLCAFIIVSWEFCFKEMQRRNISYHLEKECPNVNINCKFFSTNIKRKQEKDNTKEECILKIMTIKNEEIKSLRNELENLKSNSKS